jgi:hypothetical protein
MYGLVKWPGTLSDGMNYRDQEKFLQGSRIWGGAAWSSRYLL